MLMQMGRGAWLQVRQSGECRCRRHMGPRLHWDVSTDIYDLYIGQIRRLEKNYTFCDPCFLSLLRLKKHRSQNL